MKYYEMGDHHHWWLHPLVCRKSNKQECRMRRKMSGGHDSLYSDEKFLRMWVI